MSSEAPSLLPQDADSAQARLEALVRRDYEHFRPHDSFDDLKRRARYEKDSKGLLKHWLDVARKRRAAGADGNAPEFPVTAE